uniref:PepSY domain-containing protein n=1 Tax=candidate division WOR-3 bacterium TaxID=2052148 RepID=A0A7V6CNA4_UNCW3
MKKQWLLFSIFIILPLIFFAQEKKKVLSEKEIQKVILTEYKDAEILKLEKKTEDKQVFYLAEINYENKKLALKIDAQTGKILEKKEILTPIDEKAMELVKTIFDGEIVEWSKEVDEEEVSYTFQIKDKKGIIKNVEINISWEIEEEEEEK